MQALPRANRGRGVSLLRLKHGLRVGQASQKLFEVVAALPAPMLGENLATYVARVAKRPKWQVVRPRRPSPA